MRNLEGENYIYRLYKTIILFYGVKFKHIYIYKEILLLMGWDEID